MTMNIASNTNHILLKSPALKEAYVKSIHNKYSYRAGKLSTLGSNDVSFQPKLSHDNLKFHPGDNIKPPLPPRNTNKPVNNPEGSEDEYVEMKLIDNNQQCVKPKSSNRNITVEAKDIPKADVMASKYTATKKTPVSTNRSCTPPLSNFFRKKSVKTKSTLEELIYTPNVSNVSVNNDAVLAPKLNPKTNANATIRNFLNKDFDVGENSPNASITSLDEILHDQHVCSLLYEEDEFSLKRFSAAIKIEGEEGPYYYIRNKTITTTTTTTTTTIITDNNSNNSNNNSNNNNSNNNNNDNNNNNNNKNNSNNAGLLFASPHNANISAPRLIRATSLSTQGLRNATCNTPPQKPRTRLNHSNSISAPQSPHTITKSPKCSLSLPNSADNLNPDMLHLSIENRGNKSFSSSCNFLEDISVGSRLHEESKKMKLFYDKRKENMQK